MEILMKMPQNFTFPFKKAVIKRVNIVPPKPVIEGTGSTGRG
jgi:hypothetical protein